MKSTNKARRNKRKGAWEGGGGGVERKGTVGASNAAKSGIEGDLAINGVGHGLKDANSRSNEGKERKEGGKKRTSREKTLDVRVRVRVMAKVKTRDLGH